MRQFKLNDDRIFLCCSVSLIVIFILDLVFKWTVGGVLYVLVISLALRSTKDKHVYFFAIIASVMLIVSWRLFPDITKIWHVSIVLIWAALISGLYYKKVGITKSALAAIVDSSCDAIVGKTMDNIVISWNKAAEALLGYTKEEIVGKPDSCLAAEDKVDDEMRLLENVKNGKEIKPYQTSCRHKDGHLIEMSLTSSPIKDPFGNIVGISCIYRDISERIIAERKFKELSDKVLLERNKISKVLNIEEHLNTIFDLNKLVDFVVEKVTELLEAEKCSLMLVNYDTRELCIKAHKGIDEWFIDGRDLKTRSSISSAIAQEGNPVLVTDIETDNRFLRKKRMSYKTRSFISAPIKSGNNIMGFVNVADKNSIEGNVFTPLDLKILCMILRQVAVAMENARLYRELNQLTITDSLTHIYNFRYFTKTLDHEIIRLKRYPTRPLCLFMMDVDDFKAYNDTFGHLEGDTLLQMMSRTFEKSVREVDIVCRYAGDEFVVILPGTDISEAKLIAERIQKAVEALPLKRKMTVSIGIAKCTNYNINRYELIQNADVALYNAKKAKKVVTE